MPRSDDLPADLDPRTPGRRSHPTGVRIARVFSAVLAAALLIGSGTAYVMLNRLSSQAGTLSSTDVDGNEDTLGNPDAINILVVGNDSREGYTEEQLAELSTTSEQSLATDSIMLIHVPANAGDDKKISVMSFPRDSWVSIPGYGEGKINSAYALGYTDAPEGSTTEQRKAAGQQTLIQTVSKLSGLKVDNFVEVSLLGFYNLTNALGGIEVNLCQPAKDKDSGIDLPAGKQLLDGKQALSFVRQRKGLDAYGGDLARIKRQQYFFGAVIRKVLDMGLLESLNFSQLTEIIDSLAGTITYDEDLDPLEFADQMRYIAAGNVQFATIPLAENYEDKIDGQDVVLLADDTVLADFFGSLDDEPAEPKPTTPPPTVAPDKVTLDVYNGTTVAGAAESAAEQLTGQGFTVEGVLSASTTDYATSVVQYPKGMEAEANTVAAAVAGATTEQNDDVEKVLLVIGANYPGLGGDQPAGTTDAPQTTDPSAQPQPSDQPATAANEGCIN
ncbi:LytR family transcriptional regulator [Epidermidibacterium keratini]|uniref:LytR family transcriptional regulator n=1 Tax=Epidermidibacterium keratini TaxID=1891644 RepID=A0A7L4YRW2_9ACTN|nr:LCP family protein [Epidermidibacterium keratini]QHC01539.1 LytR family transcriptional regulator [Epidermidibacterium keratini]